MVAIHKDSLFSRVAMIALKAATFASSGTIGW